MLETGSSMAIVVLTGGDFVKPCSPGRHGLCSEELYVRRYDQCCGCRRTYLRGCCSDHDRGAAGATYTRHLSHRCCGPGTSTDGWSLDGVPAERPCTSSHAPGDV